MSGALCNFFLSLGASVIGALLGVWAAFRIDRWWERRQRKKLACDTGQRIVEEFGNNITTLGVLIDFVESMPKELEKGRLSERWFNPFAKMETAAVKYAVQHDMLDLIRGKGKIGFETRLVSNCENREGINVLLERFEEDVRGFETGMITDKNLLKRQSRLAIELTKHLQSSKETYDYFKNATGLRAFTENWLEDSSIETADES